MCGQQGMVDCPYLPPACVQNLPCLLGEPNIDLHPSDFVIPHLIQTVMVYGPDGEVIGHYEVYYTPDEYEGWDWDAQPLVLGWASWGESVATYVIAEASGGAICAACTPILLAGGGVDLINQSLIYDGRVTTGPLIPVGPVPSGPPEMNVPDFPELRLTGGTGR